MEIVVDPDNPNTVKGIYYQDSDMKQKFAANPELLAKDGTYKLNNLGIPLYLLTVKGANGKLEIVCVWLPVAEDV